MGYEKEGYRGRQYLLEEGEYHDWRVWGGSDAEMRSVRVIRAVSNEEYLFVNNSKGGANRRRNCLITKKGELCNLDLTNDDIIL